MTDTEMVYERVPPEEFEWPCFRREAHQPHTDFEQACPGVKAHPATAIGSVARVVEVFLCGHREVTPGCGGCDPRGGIERPAMVAYAPGERVMAQGEVDALLDYSHSLPTSVTVGKQWKRRASDGQGWLLGEYVEDTPGYARAVFRQIRVV